MPTTIRTGVTALAIGVSLAACSANSETAGQPTAAGQPARYSASTPPSAAAVTAQQVVTELKAHSLPVALASVYTAATDPNHLLGRPGEYTSKADFTDTRLASSATGVAAGGSVEIFPEQSDAVRRAVYIESVTQAAPVAGAEYDYVAGDILLRVSGTLTPAQATAYEDALRQITGGPVVQPSPANT
jgi:hypothetical protein